MFTQSNSPYGIVTSNSSSFQNTYTLYRNAYDYEITLNVLSVDQYHAFILLDRDVVRDLCADITYFMLFMTVSSYAIAWGHL